MRLNNADSFHGKVRRARNYESSARCIAIAGRLTWVKERRGNGDCAQDVLRAQPSALVHFRFFWRVGENETGRRRDENTGYWLLPEPVFQRLRIGSFRQCLSTPVKRTVAEVVAFCPSAHLGTGDPKDHAHIEPLATNNPRVLTM